MSPGALEWLKIVGSFLGALVGGVGAFSLKWWLDQRQLRGKEKQTRWLPLFGSALELRERLDDLTSIYKTQPPRETWDDHVWTDSAGRVHRLPTKARDFHELFWLDGGRGPIRSFQDVRVDPGPLRKDDDAVQRVRSRIHELNYATTSLYRMAKYLGYAQRVRRELEHGRLMIAGGPRNEVIELLLNVRKELNGTSEQHPGAGVIDDLQDLIGESVWDPEDCVISYYEFRGRLLRAEGWEQFTELFRFFIHFHLKMDFEVLKTSEALRKLCSALDRLA
ncbi:MAG TPA: hypothetical protein VM533_17405 [Fimbriiglobus sp.]|nr:hypothetical protein [Fimbriiglobus sp.]